MTNVYIYGGNPADPTRTGGIASHMRYLEKLTNVPDLNVRFIYIDYLLGGPLGKIKLVRRLFGLVRAFLTIMLCDRRSTTIHINSALRPKVALRDFPIVMISRLRRIPIIFQVHGGRLENLDGLIIRGWLWRKIFRMSSVIIVFRGPVEHDFRQNGYGEKIEPVSNMVPVTKAIEKFPDDEIRFLFLGRLVELKGVRYALNSFLKLCDAGYNNVSLTIAGSGPLEDDLRTIRASSKYASKIRMTGWISGEELQDVIDSCNVFLLPSSWQEGFPLAFLECAERGMSSVVTRGSAIPEYFDEGTEFLGIDVQVPDDLYNSMKLLATNVDYCRSIGSAARLKVHAGSTIDAVIPHFAGLYRNTCAKFGRPGREKALLVRQPDA